MLFLTLDAMWTEKYHPKTSVECAATISTKTEITRYLSAFEVENRNINRNGKASSKQSSNVPLLMSGGTGTGKSTLVSVILAEKGYQCTRVDPEAETKCIKIIISNYNLHHSKICLLLDDADSYGTMTQVITALQEVGKLKVPFIIICTDPNGKTMKSLKSKCNHLCMKTLPDFQLKKILLRICNKENIEIEDSDDLLAFIQDGDIRKAINQLEMNNSAPSFDQSQTHTYPFTVASRILYGDEMKLGYRLDIDRELILAIVQENIIDARSDINAISKGLDCSSNIHLIDGHYLHDVSNAMLSGIPHYLKTVDMVRSESRIFRPLRFPSSWSKLGSRNKNNRILCGVRRQFGQEDVLTGAKTLLTVLGDLLSKALKDSAPRKLSINQNKVLKDAQKFLSAYACPIHDLEDLSNIVCKSPPIPKKTISQLKKLEKAA